MTAIQDKLIAIQQQLKAPKENKNTFGNYKYRSCEDILTAVKPLLDNQKLSLILTDKVIEMAGIPIIEATAKLSDGTNEIIVTANAGVDIAKKGMDISQSFGASSSYARKYALNGLFLIDDTKDADSNEYHHQRQNNMMNDFNRAMSDIQKSDSKDKLIEIHAYFVGTQFEQQITQACTKRKQELGA